MTFQKAALVVDVRNMYTMVSRTYPNHVLMYADLVKRLEDQYNLRFVQKVAFIMNDPRKAKGFINLLKTLGFETHAAEVLWNVEMALRCAELIPTVDCLVLGTNYNEHGRILRYAKEKGKFTYCVGTNFPKDFRNVAELFTIDESLIRAKPEKESHGQQLELPAESGCDASNGVSAEASG